MSYIYFSYHGNNWLIGLSYLYPAKGHCGFLHYRSEPSFALHCFENLIPAFLIDFIRFTFIDLIRSYEPLDFAQYIYAGNTTPDQFGKASSVSPVTVLCIKGNDGNIRIA
ncbi:hypothetical protein ES703_46843 [subsurface metagenome]